MQDSLALPVSVFSGVRDKVPLQGTLAFPDDLDEWRDIHDENDRVNVPLWSPVTYREGTERDKNRTWANVESVHAIVLDYDGKPPVSMDQAQTVWGDFEHVIHTTARHTRDKPRFRLVLPLDRPARVPDEFRRVWRAVYLIAQQRQVLFDPLADAGRMYFIPTRRADVDLGAEFRHNAGEALKVDDLIAVQMQLDPGFNAGGKRSATSAASTSPPIHLPAPGTVSGVSGGLFEGIHKSHQKENWERILAQCQFAQHAVEKAEELVEPEWYAALSLVVRCKGGDALSHEVSKAHPGYSYEATEDKAKRALEDTGPATCAHIKTLSSACQGCPISGISSPIQLGAPDPSEATPDELREDQVLRAVSEIERAQEWLTRARSKAAEAAIVESTARAGASFKLRFSATSEEAEEAAKEHAKVKAALLDAKDEVKRADRAVKAARSAAKALEQAREADPATFDGLRVHSATGAPLPTKYNLVYILRNDPAYDKIFTYDLFHERVCYRKGFAEDHLDTLLCTDIERRYGIAAATALLQEAAIAVSHDYAFHPVCDYLRALEWDGTNRLEDLVQMGFGGYSEDEDYLAEAGTKMCISAVARAFEPGCQVDTMVVLVGKQGAKKSKGLRELSRGWFADTRIDIASKDGLQQLAGKWFYEVAELDSFKKAENTRIKAFITSRIDHYRPPYARHPIDRARQTVLVGSTNESEFLNDPTGSRRFVPVTITEANPDWIIEHRDQLWAEAVVRFERGEMYWYEADSADRLALISQQHQHEDPWENTIRQWLIAIGRKKQYVTIAEALMQGVMLALPQVNRQTKMRMNNVLKALGCPESRPRIDGKRIRVHTIPDDLLEAEESNVVPLPWSPSSSHQEQA